MSVPNQIRATLVDHILNHGLTMAKAGRRVQPNVVRTTVSSIIPIFLSTEQVCNLTTSTLLHNFCNASENITVFRLHFTIDSKYTLHSDILSQKLLCFASLYFFHIGLQDNSTGVAGLLSTPEQEEAFCTMVVENTAIRLRERVPFQRTTISFKTS